MSHIPEDRHKHGLVLDFSLEDNMVLKTFQDEKYQKRMQEEMAFMDDVAVQLGVFDQRCFYEAFDIFDNQSIEMSLESDNMLVRIMAVLDRRVGKRRLISMKETIEDEEASFQEFYAIRAEAEGI